MKYVLLAVALILFVVFFAWGVIAEMTPDPDPFGYEEDDWDPVWDEED